MAATYTAHGGRRYRYYVCRAGRANGVKACAVKSIAARFLEQSVIEQVRSALHAQDTREQLQISESESEAFAENNSREWIRSLVRRVVYDAAREVVSVELGR
jgi:hypothetical protein